MAISSYKIYLMQGKAADSLEKLVDIKDFPDLMQTPEALETTTLSDSMQTYIQGIRSSETLEFTCNYTKADFTALQALERVDSYYAVYFGENGADGKFSFQGQLAVVPNGAGVNEVVEMTVSITPSTPITFS